MRFSKNSLVSVILALCAISLIPACSAFEDKVTVIGEKNVSFDMLSESDYDISTNGSMAMVISSISINSTNPVGKNASIMLMSLDMNLDENPQINQNEFSNSMESILLASIKLANGIVAESIVTNSSLGKNVTLHKILMPAAKNMPAPEFIMAFWDLDEYTHAVLTSELDLNTTEEIVNTMKMLP